MCVWGGGGGGGGRRRRRGNKFHQIKNNNPHVKIKCSILLNLFLFKQTFKCMQVNSGQSKELEHIYITH